MTTFTAVRTTGIYCRPGCGARTPKPGNTQRFATAAAAEAAGYRACLRCRPYRCAPPTATGTPELVCRAVRLILAGALDGHTERELGAQLGISGRHLRRLFAEHLGCTPTQLARSARTHFARRLLDDTDLPISQLAFACGYGSTRQLSRDCLEIFRASPIELRARRRKADRLVADGGLLLRLPYQPPFDWLGTVGYFIRHAVPGVEHVTADCYRRTIAIDGDPGVLELFPGGPDYLLLRAHLPHWAGLTHIVARARAIFGLDADYESAHRHLSGDPVIGPLLLSRPGLRPPGSWSAFEAAVHAILACEAGPARARELTAELTYRYGVLVPGLSQLGLTHLFPTAATLADADLCAAGMPTALAAVVGGLTRTVADRALSFRAGSFSKLLANLLAVPGLHVTTAHSIALRLGEPDAYPDGAGVQLDGQRAQNWRPFRAVAATYLSLPSGDDITPGRCGAVRGTAARV